VGDEVRQAFVQKSPAHQDAIGQCFKAATNTESKENKWFADIYQLARLRLSLAGVENFAGGNYCTYNDKERFYSYRRDGKTGRMASLIWMDTN
jgi:copper oxidase (laccase) domain-containing protein